MGQNALYQLEPITDNPMYEGFAFVRQESLRGELGIVSDFGTNNIKTNGRAWTVPPLKPFWTPQHVVGRVKSFNDYPCVDLIIPAFSRRAVDALRGYLEPNGELLPLVSTVGEYYAYNIITVADIIDIEKSEIEWLDDNRDFSNIFSIEKYECIAEKMVDLSIFRIIEMPTSTFVTQAFVDRVYDYGLQGFHFIKHWPLPKGTTWREEDDKEREKSLRVKTEKGTKQIKGNTVVLRLSLAKAIPNKSEKSQFALLMDGLDSLLSPSSAEPNSSYLGNLEGDDLIENEFRLFLSCPDADQLAAILRPWLKSLHWKGEVKILKRYGVYTDPNCREEYLDL